MPRFTAPPPNAANRKALEERARQAAMPAAPEQKGRWPFPVADSQNPASPEKHDDSADGKPGRERE